MVCLCVGVNRRTLFISSCTTCLAHLTWMVCEMRGKWPYSYRFVGCYYQNLFKTTRSILVHFPTRFFSKRFAKFLIEFGLPDFFSIAGMRENRWMYPFPKHISVKLNTDSSRTWTRVADSVSYDGNSYAKRPSDRQFEMTVWKADISKDDGRSRGRPEGSLFSNYYTEV